MVSAAFVAPFLSEATSRFALAAARLPGVRLGVITATPFEDLQPELRSALAGHWRVQDALDAEQIADGVRGLTHQIGPVERLLGVLAQVQVPMAQVRDQLGLPGMSEDVARNVREKSRMKDVLRAAGLPCARHRLVTGVEEAEAFLAEVGLPVVAKPPPGAGGRATFRIDAEPDLRSWLQTLQDGPEQQWLLEEFLTGQEHSFDSVTLEGQTLWSSISEYRPSPLDVMRTPWVQWTVVLPQDISGPEYAEIHRVGPAALAALGVHTDFSHLEWFARPDGGVAVSEVAARPPGAQLASMIGLSHDVDFFDLYARLLVLDQFEAPERTWATGTAFLRGMGRGRVRAVHGVEEVNRDVGELVFDARLPQPGQRSSDSYEGEGWVTVRHEDTDVVREALDRIITGVRVELVEDE